MAKQKTNTTPTTKAVTLEWVPFGDLTFLENNPRTRTEEGLAKMATDIERDPSFYENRPTLVNLIDGRYQVYGGDLRAHAAHDVLGWPLIPCNVEADVPPELMRSRAILDNTHREEFDANLLAEWGYEPEELEGMGVWLADDSEEGEGGGEINAEGSEPREPGNGKDSGARRLQDRFGVPPFSVLDTRQGYWQERKRHWLSLGIKSELGRGAMTYNDHEWQREKLGKVQAFTGGGGMSKQHVTGLLMTSDSGNDPAYYFKKQSAEKKAGRELTTEEFQRDWYEGPDSYASGTSIFDPVLCELAYRWFCTEGGTVVDPFAGGSVRGIVAAILGYNYIGVELRAEQVQANRDNAAEVLGERENYPVWHCGDSIGIDGICKGVEADLVFSCPPYADLEVYSDLPGDISNMDYPEFMAAYREIIQKAVGLLKENRFACFVVGDVRDKKGFYHGFVPDTIRAFEDAGAKFYNEMVLVNVAGSLPIRAGRQFNGGRKIGKMHQNVLVFYKGDPKQIGKHFPEIDLSALEESDGVEEL